MIASDNIYIPDTNILFDFFVGQGGFTPKSGGGSGRKAVSDFLNTHRVIIPVTSLVEMMSNFFHRNIEFNNYQLWYRRRKIVFDQFLDFIFSSNSGTRVAINKALPPPMLVMDIGSREIPAHLIPQLRGGRDKYLDGADALILAEAISIARANPGFTCWLLTRDRPFAIAANDVAERARTGTAANFPRNFNVRTRF